MRTRPTRTLAIALAAAIVFGLCAVAGRGLLALPSEQIIARDPSGLLPGGTAVLSGVVVSDDRAGRPLKGVTVAIHGGPFQGDGGRTTVTNEAGRFEFRGLLAGRYVLVAQKAAYITKQYGFMQAGRGNGPIDLADGQQRTDVMMRLAHGAVIAGTLTDSNGRPASRPTRVQALEIRYTNGRRVLASAGVVANGSTDDRGVYRIYGLSAGEYFVEATPPNFSGNDIRPMTAADIQWAQQQVQRSQTTVAPPAPARPVGYAPVFYPGTPDLAGAMRVTLAAGEERTGIDFSLQYVSTAKIDGVILDPNGQLVRPTMLTMERVGQSADGGSVDSGSNVFLQQTEAGQFSASGVPPGNYRVTARTMGSPQEMFAALGRGRAGARGAGRRGAGPSEPAAPPPAADTLWAATDITVSGDDLTGVTLRLQPGLVASGHLTFDTPSALPGTAAGAVAFMRNIQVRLVPMATGEGAFGNGPLAAHVNEDGSFFVTGVLPGIYRLTTNGPGRGDGTAPGNWILERIAINGASGRNVADAPFEIGPNDKLDDIVITFFNHPAEVSGRVLDAQSRPLADYTVLLFSSDKASWGLQTRRTAQVRSTPTGDFRFGSLPPGDYYIAVVPTPDAANLGDPAFFQELVGASIKVSVAEGEKKIQDLKLAGG